jgi:hypothetical protein
MPINKGYNHKLKIEAIAEGGASLRTDEIEISVDCVILTENYTTVFTFDATM